MNNEQKAIFSIGLNEDFDQMLHFTFTDGLRKGAFAKTKNERFLTEPFHPGIAFLALKYVPPNISFDEPKWWKPYVIDEIYKGYKEAVRKDIVMRYKENTPEDDLRIERANYLIGKAWPEAKTQIDQFVTDILLFEGEGTFNGTSGWSYGTLNLTYPPGMNAIDMIDNFLHEGGHLVLLTKQAFGKMILNEQATVFSPIRKEQRLLNGVLHATYVCSQVCEGMTRLEKLEAELTTDEKQRAIFLYEQNLAIYKESLKNLDEVAEYTESGEYFMSQLRDKLKTIEQKETLFIK